MSSSIRRRNSVIAHLRCSRTSPRAFVSRHSASELRRKWNDRQEGLTATDSVRRCDHERAEMRFFSTAISGLVQRLLGGKLDPEIAYRAETLAEPNNIRARQAAGTVHVHPNGRFLYGANRAEATVEFQGKPVFKGGENSIVVYSINQSTGEPKPIQHIDTQKIH